MSDKIVVVNIMACCYSGCTWLNLVLGSHSKMFSVGEFKRVLRRKQALCRVHGEECPLWSRYDPHSSENPLKQVARLSQKPVLIINRSRNTLPFQEDPDITPKIVHVVRDGRAVTASMIRKNKCESMAQAAKLWSHEVRRSERLCRRCRPSIETLRLQYERIKQDPNTQIAHLCEFIGVEPEPAMQEYWHGDRHYIDGNRGTTLLLAKQMGLPALSPERKPETFARNWHLDYYQNANAGAFVDERWKDELTDRQLRVFGRIAGRLNRRLGYPRTFDRSTDVVPTTP